MRKEERNNSKEKKNNRRVTLNQNIRGSAQLGGRGSRGFMSAAAEMSRCAGSPSLNSPLTWCALVAPLCRGICATSVSASPAPRRVRNIERTQPCPTPSAARAVGSERSTRRVPSLCPAAGGSPRSSFTDTVPPTVASGLHNPAAAGG